jgi:hypothetical protein
MSSIRRTAAGFALALACSASAAAQTTWYVDVNAVPPGAGTQAQPYASIQYAIDQATTASHDTLLVGPGVYAENVLSLSKFLNLRSTHGPHVTVIRPTASGYVVQMPSGFADYPFPVVDGFRLQGTQGLDINGIGAGEIVVKNCIIDAGYDASATFQIGIQATISVRLERSTIVNFGRAVTLNDFFGDPQETRLSNSILDRGVHGTALSLEYCQYNGQLGGAVLLAGNVFAPPALWSPATGDVHLKPFSPCIDAANPTLPLDPDGSRADIGVLPYDPTYAATPTTYCTGKLHSAGCTPRVRFTGTASFSGPDDFHVVADTALNGKPGLVLWGPAPANTPFQGGTLCVSSPIVRGPPHNTGGSTAGADCTGRFDMHFGNAYAQSRGILPGTNVYAQAWGRDPGYAAPNNSQLSDAGVFEFAP